MKPETFYHIYNQAVGNDDLFKSSDNYFYFLKLANKHLQPVKKISKVEYGNSSVRDYVFRHHLETTVSEKKELKGVTYKAIKSLGHLKGIVKVRINHIGKIVQVGEY